MRKIFISFAIIMTLNERLHVYLRRVNLSISFENISLQTPKIDLGSVFFTDDEKLRCCVFGRATMGFQRILAIVDITQSKIYPKEKDNYFH